MNQSSGDLSEPKNSLRCSLPHWEEQQPVGHTKNPNKYLSCFFVSPTTHCLVWLTRSLRKCWVENFRDLRKRTGQMVENWCRKLKWWNLVILLTSDNLTYSWYLSSSLATCNSQPKTAQPAVNACNFGIFLGSCSISRTHAGNHGCQRCNKLLAPSSAWHVHHRFLTRRRYTLEK